MEETELIQIADPPPRAPRATDPELVFFRRGFYGEEMEAGEGFRWMARTGSIEIVDAGDKKRLFLELWVWSPFFDLSQELMLGSGAFALAHGWAPVSLELEPQTREVELEVSRVFPREHYEGDSRELAVRVKRPLLHSDAGRHQGVVRRQENDVLNLREMLAGKSSLESLPPSLGIDLHGVCNIKPPCVYCQWDEMKSQEAENAETPFTRETLEEYGDFFGNAAKLVNCSIGEPFMMKALDGILDAFGEQGKTVEMSTNGQILTDRNIEKLLGRDIHLYVSLDAATQETYGKLRNDKFERILGNLRRLVAAKGGRGGLPRLYLVFMPIRVNAHELEAFVELCADLPADQLILRPLDPSESIDLKWERGGYEFDYQKETLPFEELIRLSATAHDLCRRLGVPLSNQLDFGGHTGEKIQELLDDPGGEDSTSVSDSGSESQPDKSPPQARPNESAREHTSLGSERWPICTEPWRSFYILRRGVLPCCYGGRPVAEASGYRESWNGPLLRAIRRDLAAGRFHSYCIRTRSCPIVQKSEAVRRLTSLGRVYRWLQPVGHRLNRLSGGRLMAFVKKAEQATVGVSRRLGGLLGK